jgi:CRP-like cAMP-binding protein
MSRDAAIGLLAGLDPEIAASLLEQAQRRILQADEVIFTEGSPAQAVHVLVSGAARLVQTTPDGARVIIKHVIPGEIFGSPALLNGTYPVDAVSVADSVELQWPSQLIRDLVTRHPAIALNVIRDLEARLREMESRVRDLSNEPVEQRLARTILRLVDKFGVQGPDGVEIPFPVSRQDLADLIGCTLHTVSRTLQAWEAQRQIRRRRRRLVVANLNAVAKILETPPSKQKYRQRI